MRRQDVERTFLIAQTVPKDWRKSRRCDWPEKARFRVGRGSTGECPPKPHPCRKVQRAPSFSSRPRPCASSLTEETSQPPTKIVHCSLSLYKHALYLILQNQVFVMDVSDITPELEQLDVDLDKLQEVLQPLLGDVGDISTKLPLLDKAKLYVLVSYALESIIFCEPPPLPHSPSFADTSHSFSSPQRSRHQEPCHCQRVDTCQAIL